MPPNPPLVVVLDLAASPELDIAGIDLLGALQRDLTNAGCEPWLFEASPAVTDLIARSELAGDIPPEHVFARNRDAWHAFRDRFIFRPGVPNRVANGLEGVT